MQKKTMPAARLALFYTLFSLFSRVLTSTLSSSQSIVDGHMQTLLSEGGTFELGFFSPSPISNNRYVGIWYKNVPERTIVWVANRGFPLHDKSGVLKIDSTGNLVIQDRKTDNGFIWSTNSSKAVPYPILEFLKSGNLVLRDSRSSDPKSYVWQSFDHPTDTILPGMKFGWDLYAGINRYVTSWKNSGDPSPGDFTFGLELAGYPEFVMRKGANKYYREGPWNGLHGTASPELMPNKEFTYDYINNGKDMHFMYKPVNQSNLMRFVLRQTSVSTAQIQFTWLNRKNEWVLHLSEPRDQCDAYARCGAYSACDSRDVEVCQCLQGFKPKSSQDWSQSDWSQGCEREMPVNCSKGEGFRKYIGLKLPETTSSWFDTRMSLEECRVKCFSNCSCIAYANSDIREGGRGCILWFTELIDIRNLAGGQDIYIRTVSSNLAKDSYISSKSRSKKISVILLARIASIAGIIALGLGCYFIWSRLISEVGSVIDDFGLPLSTINDDLVLYDLTAITTATNNFSDENKLGEGGFGSVYKGTLNGEEVAVKRLSKFSIQGIDEFKNEIKLISKLQHKNLVRILGCCVQGEEKMLVYEYLENKSLDLLLCDVTTSRLLDWEKRFQIILGVARGLLYLHHDSRLKIIHRDMKTSNILLDKDMVPKISDFGMARIFDRDQIVETTTRVVGTRGYMSPEYLIDGRYSVKSDVFSFGVIVLEIVSGKKNRSFSHPDHQLNLLGHAWGLWCEKSPIKLVDESVSSSSSRVEEMVRCVHVGLLCVQKLIEKRPTMSEVLLMLSSETAILPDPQSPGFYVERSTYIAENSCCSSSVPCNVNEESITILEAR